MIGKDEIRQNLTDAGISGEEAELILSCLACNEKKKADQLIDSCRHKYLERIHDSQACIDRLDYLCYALRDESETH